MFEANLKLTDGEVIKGWMGKELPSKLGYTSIKMEVAGGIAFIPDDEVDDSTMGKLVNIDDITITAPEKSVELASTGKENPGGGFYHKPSVVKAGSSLEMVIAVMNKNINADRKTAMAMVVEELGKSKAFASTYCNNAKPFLNPNHNLYKAD